MKRIVLDEDTCVSLSRGKTQSGLCKFFLIKRLLFPNPGLLLTLPLLVPFSMKYFFKITFETYLEKVLPLLPGIHFLIIADGQILTVFLVLL